MPVAPLRPSSPSVSVVVPAGAALPIVLAALPAVAEVIVVVGRDQDTTTAVPGATRVIRQTRAGVGNALACGVAASSGDIVVTLPGDGSCDPAELPRYLEALRNGADVAQGSRFRGDGRDLAGGRMSRAGARIVLWLMAVLFGCRRSDPGFGFRAFWSDVAGAVGLPRVSGVDPVRGDGVEIEPLLTVRAGLNGLFVTEVPAVAHPRTAPASRAGLVDAVRALAGEYVARRRAARETELDSIVVMTGRRRAAAEPGLLGRTGTDAGLINPSIRSRTAMAERAGAGPLPSGGVMGARRPAAGSRNGPTPGSGRARVTDPGVERRRGARRAGGTGSGVPARAAGRVPGDAPTARRHWRDNQGREAGDGRRRMQGQPNLWVINGEGGGDGSSRTGNLRSVPPTDRNS